MTIEYTDVDDLIMQIKRDYPTAKIVDRGGAVDIFFEDGGFLGVGRVIDTNTLS